MGIEIVIMLAHIFGNDVNSALQYERRALKQVQVQQQVLIENQDINTKRILREIKEKMEK